MAQRKQIQAISIIALLALMIVLMGMVFLPYASVLLWTAVCYILVSPLYFKILRKMDAGKRLYELKRHFLSGFFAVGTVLIMGGVFFFVMVQLIGQGRIFLAAIQRFLEVNPYFFAETDAGATIARMVNKLSLGTVDLSTMDVKTQALSFVSQYSETIAHMTRGIVANIGRFFLSLAFICFALYFFYLDGAYLANLFISAIPIDRASTRRLLRKFHDVTTNLFMGFFLVAFYQAVAAFVIFASFRVEGALLFSVLILFSSFIPMVGCALVWLPLGLSVMATRGVGMGIAFMALCAVFISFLDNFLRPMFLKDRIKIHPLLIFFSIIGGLQVFGFNGIILGPLVVILFFTIVDIALEEDTALPVAGTKG